MLVFILISVLLATFAVICVTSWLALQWLRVPAVPRLILAFCVGLLCLLCTQFGTFESAEPNIADFVIPLTLPHTALVLSLIVIVGLWLIKTISEAADIDIQKDERRSRH